MPRINLSEETMVGLAFFAPMVVPDSNGDSWETAPADKRLMTADSMFKLLKHILTDVFEDDPEALMSRLTAINPVLEDASKLADQGVPMAEAARAALRMNPPIKRQSR